MRALSTVLAWGVKTNVGYVNDHVRILLSIERVGGAKVIVAPLRLTVTSHGSVWSWRRRVLMAKGKRRRAPNDGGSIDRRSSGRWRLRVRIDDRQVAYGTFETEDEAVRAQAPVSMRGRLSPEALGAPRSSRQ